MIVSDCFRIWIQLWCHQRNLNWRTWPSPREVTFYLWNEYHTLILVQKISQNMHFEVRRNIGNPCPTPPSLRTIVNFKIVVFVINFQLWLSRQDVITTYSVLNIGDIMPTGHHRWGETIGFGYIYPLKKWPHNARRFHSRCTPKIDINSLETLNFERFYPFLLKQ